jgi:N-acetylmuramic acid 6-phosphate etherase
MILNMLTTGAMARIGYVYGNLMVNLHTKNSKLAERAVAIIEQLTGLDRRGAIRLLSRAQGRVPVALVMAKAGVKRDEALIALKKSRGSVRRALASLHLK